MRPAERRKVLMTHFVIKILTRLRLSFSHLCFQDTLNLLCSCSIEPETTTQYFLRCYFYNSNRATLMNDLENISISFSTISDNNLISVLLYGDDKLDGTKNQKLLMSAMRFIKDGRESFYVFTLLLFLCK